MDDWNHTNPSLTITQVGRDARLDGEDGAGEDERAEDRYGDQALQHLNRLRGMLVPRDRWPSTVREFERKWSDYKRASGLLDFTDLIDTCLLDMRIAPGNPAVLFADEAQDLNPMQLALVRKWGERAEYFILAGDDDQTIYGFGGATPDAILDPDIPQDHKIILKQSYRVPRAVQQFAEALIRQVARRQAKTYLPRDAMGAVERVSVGGYKSPEYYLLRSAEAHLKRGETVMFLAACSYMLWPIMAVLRKNGIPFHNPYRKANGYWNPIRLGKAGSGANRVLALLAVLPEPGARDRLWTHGELGAWTEWMVDGIFTTGAKQRIAARDARVPVTIGDLVETFTPAAMDSLVAACDGSRRDLVRWWQSRLMPQARNRVELPAEIAAAHGAHALLDEPKVVVGTIHSVKGGQADVVYLFPDLSQAGDEGFIGGGAGRDTVIRLFYVGATRARRKLYICQAETSRAMSFAGCGILASV